MPLMEIQMQIKANRSAVDRRMERTVPGGNGQDRDDQERKATDHRVADSFGREVANQMMLINGLENLTGQWEAGLRLFDRHMKDN